MIISKSNVNKFLQNTVSRSLRLEFWEDSSNKLTYENENIILDSFELTQSICDSDEFKLGGCIAGEMKVGLYNVPINLTNYRVAVYLIIEYYDTDSILTSSSNLYPSNDLHPGFPKATAEVRMFTGTVDSCKTKSNYYVKELIAYDDMYFLNKCKCGAWMKDAILNKYNKFGSCFTLREFVDLVKERFEIDMSRGISFNRDGTFNDDKILNFSYDLVKEIINNDLTVGDLLNAYFELNSSFGVISRAGALTNAKLWHYTNLSQTSTAKQDIDDEIDSFSSLEFESYATRPISNLWFRYNKDKIFKYGHDSARPSWYTSENIITSCCTDITELVTEFNNNEGNNYLFNNIYTFKPFTADVYDRWWLEAGDRVKLTKNQYHPDTGNLQTTTIDSFVLFRTIKGISRMRVIIEAKGSEYMDKNEMEET